MNFFVDASWPVLARWSQVRLPFFAEFSFGGNEGYAGDIFVRLSVDLLGNLLKTQGYFSLFGVLHPVGKPGRQFSAGGWRYSSR
jgi:hypothetical protein